MDHESPEEHRRRLLAMAEAEEGKAGRARERGGRRKAGKDKGGASGKLRPCKECGDPVARTARRCPHCGASITPEDQQKVAKGCLVVVAAIVLCYFLLKSCGSSEEWHERDNSISAYNRAKQYVTSQLKSPSTADFPSVFTRQGHHTTYLGEQRYQIRSFVDSKNSFGAVVRTAFVAGVRQTGSGTWVLESLELDP